MSGFPRRVSRDTFGPTLVDVYAAENPEADIPAKAFNTLFHQVGGLNVSSITRAVVVAEWTGTAMGVAYQSEAWNPNGDQAHPVVARTSMGLYTVTFASSYLDETGASISTQLLLARATFMGQVSTWASRRVAYAWVDTSNPLIVNVSMWNPGTGGLADAKFLLEVA